MSCSVVFLLQNAEQGAKLCIFTNYSLILMAKAWFECDFFYKGIYFMNLENSLPSSIEVPKNGCDEIETSCNSQECLKWSQPLYKIACSDSAEYCCQCPGRIWNPCSGRMSNSSRNGKTYFGFFVRVIWGGGEGYIHVCVCASVRMMALGTYHEGILHTQVRCPDQSEIRVTFRIWMFLGG